MKIFGVGFEPTTSGLDLRSNERTNERASERANERTNEQLY